MDDTCSVVKNENKCKQQNECFSALELLEVTQSSRLIELLYETAVIERVPPFLAEVQSCKK